MNCSPFNKLVFILLLSAGTAFSAESVYDPLEVSEGTKTKIVDLTVNDKGRQRDIPIRVYLPFTDTAAPVVLFSHGLGGSRKGSSYLGKHWAARGYVAIFVQHPGSDTFVWQDKPLRERMKALKQAASPLNFFFRVRDIPAVLNQLDRWNKAKGHVLADRLDLDHIGMSGHSFGAVTTQAVGGQRIAGGKAMFTDSRIDAAIVLSPSSPRHGRSQNAFSKVKIPWMLMTGTKDTVPIGNADMKSRLAVFPALPPGGKYELLLGEAEHSAFTERPLPGDTKKRNPNHHRIILALSTAFWDTWLREDDNARDWLHGKGPHSVLEEDDRWQLK